MRIVEEVSDMVSTYISNERQSGETKLKNGPREMADLTGRSLEGSQ